MVVINVEKHEFLRQEDLATNTSQYCERSTDVNDVIKCVRLSGSLIPFVALLSDRKFAYVEFEKQDSRTCKL